MPTWTVGDAARLARVTIRTLHHYRLYDAADLQRLHLIRLYRQLGLGLEPIRRILDDPAFDRNIALGEHRQRLLDELSHTQNQVDTIDRILHGDTMPSDQLFNGFNPYEDEARERWGDTAPFQESARRTKAYGPDDWTRIREETMSNEGAFANALRAATAPDSAAAMDLAEAARRHIDRWYYPCSHAMHVSLGEMYVADPRFTQHYDQQEPGLAAFVAAAIRANAERV